MTDTKIINLTQHAATAEQKAVGVIDLDIDLQSKLHLLLTFTSVPTKLEMEDRARQIAKIANPYTAALIGGAPYFMPILEKVLKEANIKVLYSFTQRVSIEKTMPDGTVLKTAVFQHKAFVEA